MMSETPGRPFFSVVTVTLNCVQDAVMTSESVLSQSYKHYEYIVKDGGSTDGTVGALRKVGVKKLYVSADTGIYDAMNQALALCRGRYVCFLNAGDLFVEPDVLSRVERWIAKQGYPSFVYGGVLLLGGREVLEDCSPEQVGRKLYYRDKLSRFYLFRRVVNHQAWFVETNVYRELGGFDTSFPISAMYDVLLNMVLRKKLRYSRVPLVTTIYKGGGVSEIMREERLKDHAQIRRRYFSFCERLLYGLLTRCFTYGGRLLRHTVLDSLDSETQAFLNGY